MGSDAGFFPEDGEGPAREVTVSPFRIGQHEVSNARFQAFVDATGYVTEAERFGNSFVVEQFVSKAESAKVTSAVAAGEFTVAVAPFFAHIRCAASYSCGDAGDSLIRGGSGASTFHADCMLFLFRRSFLLPLSFSLYNDNASL